MYMNIELFDKDGNKIPIYDVIKPFWLWVVREANIEIIDQELLTPVMSFKELVELYLNNK